MPVPAKGDSFEKAEGAPTGSSEESPRGQADAEGRIDGAICFMLEHTNGDSFEEFPRAPIGRSPELPYAEDSKQGVLSRALNAWEARLDLHLREHEARVENILLKHLSLREHGAIQESVAKFQWNPGENARLRDPSFSGRPKASSFGRRTTTSARQASMYHPDASTSQSYGSQSCITVSPTPSDEGVEKRNSMIARAEAAKKQEEEDMKRLKTVFSVAREHAEAEADRAAKSGLQRIGEMPKADKAHLLDLIMGGVIFFNMMVIGLSMDSGPNLGMMALDGLLSACFIIEIILKVRLFGCRGHFFPPNCRAKAENCLDGALVMIDLTQFCVQLVNTSDASSEMRTSLLRLLRLMRLMRIIRVLRLEMFHDLVLMISGMASSMSVLMWAVLLFSITIYVVAMITRMTLGATGPESIQSEFDTLETSLFTVFRCSFGDCNTRNGRPIISQVIDAHGGVAAALLAIFVFFVTIGLFNVISAIFVEATLSAKLSSERKAAEKRLNDFTLFSVNMKILIERVVQVSNESNGRESTNEDDMFASSNFAAWSKEEVDTVAFKKACTEDACVQQALRELDIHEGDFAELADILDPQNDGQITLHEILMGITRLRGEPRRSDIVNVDLMIRDVQWVVSNIRQMMTELIQSSPTRNTAQKED